MFNKGLRTNLQGLLAITTLNLAAKVYSTESHQNFIRYTYMKVLHGLGNFGQPYNVTLKPDVQPYCLFMPRRVSLSLRWKVKEELERMESFGVISKVEAPMHWCAGMVAVPKIQEPSTFMWI